MNASKSELSYTSTSLAASSSLRSDGRSLLDYRPIRLSTGIFAQANGSARVECGHSQVSVGVTCSVVTIDSDASDRNATFKGSINCNVIWWAPSRGVYQFRSLPLYSSPAAYPSHSPSTLDELSEEFTAILSDVYSQPGMLPSNLVIIPGRKVWSLHLDALILSEDGNIMDILFLAARAALYDCRVPATRSIQYKAQASIGNESSLDTRTSKSEAADFELKDYWDDGEPLSNRDLFPVAITLHLVWSSYPSVFGCLNSL